MYTAHLSIRPIHTTSIFAWASSECSANDQTCTTTSRCQIETHDNCSSKEIEYIKKMKPKSSQDRKQQIDRLKELLSRDAEGVKSINADLIPWIQDRLYILYALEGLDAAELTESQAAATAADAQGGTGAALDDKESKSIQNGNNTDSTVRLITSEELAEHVTEEKQIWLSILGKVYDVTTGLSFYGPNSGSYSFYAGRDASPCFSTGKNNLEGAAEDMQEWEGKRLLAVMEWSEFYEKHETYKYLGLLAGSKYYDEEGNEKEYRRIILEKAGEAKIQAEKEKEEKKKARLEKKKKLQEERERKKVKAWGVGNQHSIDKVKAHTAIIINGTILSR